MEALIVVTGILEKLILLFMIGLSVWSVSIMIDRKRVLKKWVSASEFDQIQSQILKNDLRSESVTGGGFYAEGLRLLLSGQKSNIKDMAVLQLQTDREISYFLKEKRQVLNKNLYILASLGSNAPFIGLFGTVLGIIRAFAYLGSQSGSAAVMSGVSQALYATAIGLVVAIPAVTAYNYFSNQIKKATTNLEYLRDLYLSQQYKK
jgi:biopolymer transport protein TolQ